MAVGDAYVFPGFLTPVLTQLFFPKPPTTFLTCFCRGERRKYARKKSRLTRGSNSQPPGHESDTLTTEPPGRGTRTDGLMEGGTDRQRRTVSDHNSSPEQFKNCGKRRKCWFPVFTHFPRLFYKVLFSRIFKTCDCLVKI